MIDLVPVLFEIYAEPGEPGFYTGMVIGSLLYFVGPLVQLSGVVALWAQARTIMSTEPPIALSVEGLLDQSLVFLLIGISFSFRFQMDPEYSNPYFIVYLRDWYWSLGWATINNIIFAFGQGVLAIIACRYRSNRSEELQPLLG